MLLAILVFTVVEEPLRGSTDIGHNYKGVQGQSGIRAYLLDVKYCLTKLVVLCLCIDSIVSSLLYPTPLQ